MSQTADFQAVQPRRKEKEQEAIKKDITRLLIQRKDLSRFLQIDKEKEGLLKLQIEAKKMKIKAQNVALDIVAKAKVEADGLRSKSLKDRDVALSFMEKQTVETTKLLEDAKMRQAVAKKHLEGAIVKSEVANEKLRAAEEGLKAFKLKVKRASKSLADMADQ